MQEKIKSEWLKKLFPLIIILCFLFVFTGGIIFEKTRKTNENANSSGNQTQTSDVTPEPTLTTKLAGLQVENIPKVTSKDHIRGALNPKVYIIEYSDLECPYCKDFQLTLKNVIESYSDKVAWVYRHYPIDSLHSKARSEAQAAECAFQVGGNDAFWKYIDSVYEVTPSNNGLDSSQLPKIAGQIGLDVTKFNKCVSGGETVSVVDNDYQGGVKAGIRGTPQGYILNDKGEAWTLPGAYSFDKLKIIIDQALAN